MKQNSLFQILHFHSLILPVPLVSISRTMAMASSKKNTSTNLFSCLCSSVLILGLLLYSSMSYLSQNYPNCVRPSDFFPSLTKFTSDTSGFPSESVPLSKTNLSHIVFGLVGSEKGWHHRIHYIESWWRPNMTRGFLFLENAPAKKLLPWSPKSPPYRISADLTVFLNKTEVYHQRIINGIMETFNEDHEDLRWLVMGDDDSILFVDNIVEVLAQYDNTKYYYIGGHSEFVLSNYRFSFSQAFGGSGIILSYPLAKALAEDMKNCLLRYRHVNAADTTTHYCVADFGVSLTALKGIHQLDLWGVIWGYLSAHPNSPLMSLHHFDSLTPLFPTMDRVNSARHLMKAASHDQSRMLQHTICYHRETNWSFSISWGYSAQIYENILPRSYLKMPIETFKPWVAKTPRPLYMFNTRLPSKNPCEAPHVFFYETIETLENEILTNFTRAWPRSMPACSSAGNHSADSVSTILVYSPANKRLGMDRSECCDVTRVEGDTAEVKFRECEVAERIA